MARQENYVRVTCDKCGDEAYMQSTDPKLASWVQVERITAQSVPEKPLLCPTCLKSYKDFVSGQDNEYRIWLNGGN